MMAQVNVYESGTDRERFALYADQFGLDVTALSNLLFARELRVGRLAQLAGRPNLGSTRRDSKVTAHLSPSRRAAFVCHAKSVGLRISEAGAALVLAELEERWLEKSVDN
jgi:hypothetical protein